MKSDIARSDPLMLLNSKFLEKLINKYQNNETIKDFKGIDYKTGGIVIIGQDPGITTQSTVDTVLMLDNEKSNLFKYVKKNILDPLDVSINAIVAINLIESKFTTSLRNITKKEKVSFYLLVSKIAQEYFSLFEMKLSKYKPKYLITLGKPVFYFLLSKSNAKSLELKKVFARKIPIAINQERYILIPCVHYNSRNIEIYKNQKDKLSNLRLS